MVVSFHLIFVGWKFSPRKFLGIFLFLQFESTKAFCLSYMAASSPICNLVRIMEVLGLETFVCFLSINIGDTHRHIIILYEFVHGSTCILWYNYIHDLYLHTILDGHHSWIMMRGTTSMHLQWRLLSDQQEDDHTCAHGEKFHASLRMLKPSGIWQAITWLPGQIQFETSLQFHGFFPHSRHIFLNFPGLCGWVQLVFVYHLWGRGLYIAVNEVLLYQL